MTDIGDIRRAAGIDLQIDANGPRLYRDSAFTTAQSVGTPGTNVTAVEYGDKFRHRTELTLTAIPITVGDNASLGVGALIYTLPAGAVIVEDGYMSVGVTGGDADQTSDPICALGTVIASGAVADTVTPGTFENISTGKASVNVIGTAVVQTAKTTDAVGGLAIETGDAHTIHFNMAAAWADVTVATATLTGTVVLNWRWMA
jgi:hypothetical protein